MLLSTKELQLVPKTLPLPSCVFHKSIELAGRAIYTPMMSVTWVLLIQIHFEEFIMFVALEVLLTNLKLAHPDHLRG